MKQHSYARALASFHKTHLGFIKKAVLAVVAAVYPYIMSLPNSPDMRAAGVSVSISSKELLWIACHAFLAIMTRFPQLYEDAIACLRQKQGEAEGALGVETTGSLRQLARSAYSADFASMRF